MRMHTTLCACPLGGTGEERRGLKHRGVILQSPAPGQDLPPAGSSPFLAVGAKGTDKHCRASSACRVPPAQPGARLPSPHMGTCPRLCSRGPPTAMGAEGAARG